MSNLLKFGFSVETSQRPGEKESSEGEMEYFVFDNLVSYCVSWLVLNAIGLYTLPCTFASHVTV